MQCQHCGSQLSEGVAFCQQCGTPVPPPPSSIAPTIAAFPQSYNTPGSNPNYNPSSLPPTVAASPQSYNTPGSDVNYNPSAIPPTVAAAPPSYGSSGPYTNYNPSSPPSGGNQGYEAPPNPYANTPYNQPPSGNMAPPPPNNMPPYNMPFPNNNAAYAQGAPNFVATPVKPKSNVGLIVGIVIAVLLVACVGSTVLVASLAHTGSSENTSVSTPTPDVPSRNNIDPTAASIVTNIQMASAVDTVSAQPKTLTKSFKTYTPIYSTFDLNLDNSGVSSGDPGYVEAKFYLGTTLVSTSDPLTIDDATIPGRYFSAEYYRASTSGSVELYWCKQSTCSDEALAGIATFTVS